MDGAHLCDADTKLNLHEIELENSHDLGDGGCGQAQISTGQHVQEVKHGLVEL